MPRHTPPPPAAPPTLPAAAPTRMSPQDRRRQLVGIGLRKFVDRPVQELSIDEVAAEAGVSRGLLFHYFPTKTAYYRAVVEAAGRRVLRNVSPDPELTGQPALTQLVERFYRQVARRRDSYLALVHGQVGALHDGAGEEHVDRAASLRERIARVAMTFVELPETALPAAHGWVAYIEDRALQWSALPGPIRDSTLAAEIAHCVAALPLLTTLDAPRAASGPLTVDR